MMLRSSDTCLISGTAFVSLGVTTAGRSWLFESWDEVVVIEVFGSLPVSELRPRKAVSTKIKVRAIFDDLPARSAAFL